MERSEDDDEEKGRATMFSTEGRAFAVAAAFSVYLDRKDIGISSNQRMLNVWRISKPVHKA